MEKRILYFDCFSGISGDMTIGALLDLGIDQVEFLKRLKKVKPEEYDIEIKKGIKKGITGTDFTVHLRNQENKKEIKFDSNFTFESISNQNHFQIREHNHSRNLYDINQIIDQAELSDEVKKISKQIFQLIAEAEAKIHGKTIEQVHFHEVGATDSIVDIIGTAICIEMLHVDEIQSSALNLGSGFVKCDHGIFPVPAPATLEILKNVPVYSKNAQKELTTPTGAAIIKNLCSAFGDLPGLSIEKIGYGLGKREMDTPNVLRVVVGKQTISQSLMMLETNIDNMNPEIYSYLFPELLENNALDVFVTPIIMKKNRPANKLSVLCDEEHVGKIEEIIFNETTTLGIRKYRVEREELKREFGKVSTKFGEITVKYAYKNGELIKYSPEYEDCQLIAKKTGIPLYLIYNEVVDEVKKGLSRP